MAVSGEYQMTNTNGEISAKKGIAIPLIQGVVITYAFLLLEYVFQELGFFDGVIRLYTIDPALRFLFGGVTLYLISANYKKQRSAYSLKECLTNRFSGKAYIYMFPFFLYLILILVSTLFSTASSFSMAGVFALNCIQQLGTGFYEEAIRVLILCGLVKFYCDTRSRMIKTVLISGTLFGLSHGLNFLYGQDILSTLWQVGSCFLWGMFMAALFLYTKNLTLLMILHAVWDIIIRVPNAFFGFPDQSAGLLILDIAGYVIDYGLLTFTAIMICIKLSGKQEISSEPEKAI